MTTTKGATQEVVPEGPVSKEAADDIEKAVEEAFKEEPKAEEEIPAKETEEKKVEDTPKEDEEETVDQGEESEESDQEEETPDEPEGEDEPSITEAETDELLTRAVRAGISLKDAKSFAKQDAEALGRQIELLEETKQSVSKAGEGTGEADAGVIADADEDPLAGIPDLDPEVVDESIVEAFQGMKSIIKKQYETINNQGKTIRDLSSSNEKSTFDSFVDGLKVKNLSPSKVSELNDQYDILKAGYEAKGQEVNDKAVFQQATKLVLGDEIKKTKTAEKAKKLEKREKMHTNRPSGPTVKPKGDPFDEVADEIDREFFNKR